VGIGQGKFIRQLVARVCRLMVVRLRSDVFECSILMNWVLRFFWVCVVLMDLVMLVWCGFDMDWLPS